MQHLALHLVAELDAIGRHLGAQPQHLAGHLELLLHDGGRALLFRQRQGLLPAGHRQLLGDLLGEGDRSGRAVLYLQHGEGRPQAEEAHAMAALGGDLLALLRERQLIDLHHVVQHAGEDGHYLAKRLPVKGGTLGEGIADKLGQIDRPQQAGAIGGQGLLTTGVGGTDLLAEPVVVHLIDLVDQDETGLRIVIGRGHDDVPQLARRQSLVDLAGHLPQCIDHHSFLVRPVGPEHLSGIIQGYAVLLHLFGGVGEDEPPGSILLHRLDELFGDQQGEVELAQATIFPLGLDELDHVGMPDIHGAHLGATATARRRDGETHLVVDIHEGERARGIGPGAGDEGATRAQGREVITDAAARFQGQAGLVHLAENVVHRIFDGAGDGAVDGRGGRLVLEGPGIGSDATRRDGAIAQGPQEGLIPGIGLALLGRQRTGNPLISLVYGAIDGRPILALEAILAVPDLEGGFLHGDEGRVGSTLQNRVGFSHFQATLCECNNVMTELKTQPIDFI
ncbi:hypothetical protein D3C85_892760 [compost metagenome]